MCNTSGLFPSIALNISSVATVPLSVLMEIPAWEKSFVSVRISFVVPGNGFHSPPRKSRYLRRITQTLKYCYHLPKEVYSTWKPTTMIWKHCNRFPPTPSLKLVWAQKLHGWQPTVYLAVVLIHTCRLTCMLRLHVSPGKQLG